MAFFLFLIELVKVWEFHIDGTVFIQYRLLVEIKVFHDERGVFVFFCDMVEDLSLELDDMGLAVGLSDVNHTVSTNDFQGLSEWDEFVRDSVKKFHFNY